MGSKFESENLPKKRYLKVKSVSQGSFYIDELNDTNIGMVADMLNDSEVDDGYELTIIEMTEEEFKNLPEFDGF
jgi:hypothetical protein